MYRFSILSRQRTFKLLLRQSGTLVSLRCFPHMNAPSWCNFMGRYLCLLGKHGHLWKIGHLCCRPNSLLGGLWRASSTFLAHRYTYFALAHGSIPCSSGSLPMPSKISGKICVRCCLHHQNCCLWGGPPSTYSLVFCNHVCVWPALTHHAPYSHYQCVLWSCYLGSYLSPQDHFYHQLVFLRSFQYHYCP